MLDLATNIAIISTVFAAIQTYFAVAQTVRLRNVKKIRDTHIQNLLRESRELAGHLFRHAHGNGEVLLAAEKAQQMQKSLWLLIVNMFDLHMDDVDRMREDLGDFEYGILKHMVTNMKPKPVS
jgi:hypothetical protein